MMDGTTAYLQVGQSIPWLPHPISREAVTKFSYDHMGVSLEVHPKLLDDGRIHLGFHHRLSRCDESDVCLIDGQQFPCVSTREFESDLEMPLGQTTVLSGFVEKRVEAGKSKPVEIQLLMLLQPEVVKAESSESTPTAATSCPKPADWFESAISACDSKCAQPVSCDEASACKCVAAGLSCDKSGIQTRCLSVERNIFASPASWNATGPQTIYVDPASFNLPTPQTPLSFDYESPAPGTPARFAPENAKPIRMAQPVVVPVERLDR